MNYSSRTSIATVKEGKYSVKYFAIVVMVTIHVEQCFNFLDLLQR